MAHCEKFCKGPISTSNGLIASKLSVIFGNAKTKKLIAYKDDLHYPCPLGFTHNPSTEKATHNIIRNNGRHTICHNNLWKYDQL